jgi:hypothetical protein
MSEEGLLDHWVYSKNVIEFATVALEYCSFVENHTAFSRSSFIDKAHKIFPLLYLKASLLPDIDEDNTESPEKYLSEVDYNFLLSKISAKLGQFDSYPEVFDSGMQFSEEAISANISENICDIYQDLKDFIMVYRIGTTELMADAVWECKNNFATYWGQKLVNGLRALHAVRYGEVSIDDEQSPKLNQAPQHENDNWVSRHFNNYFDEEETR